MADEFLTGPELLAYVAGGVTTTPDDAAWADDVAAAVNAAMVHELDYPPDGTLPLEAIDDLHVAALAIGAERWKRREAPWGVAGFDVSGGAIRVSSDDLIAGRVALTRWAWSATIGVG